MWPVEKLPELFLSLDKNAEITAPPKSILRDARMPKMMSIRSKKMIKLT
jgi:hypothetical protein